MEVVRAIRNARAEKGVAPARAIPAVIAAGEHAGTLEGLRAPLAALARLDDDHLLITHYLSQRPAGAVTLVVGGVEVCLPLAGMVDLEAERARLEKQLAETEAQFQRVEGLLASDFATRAPAPVVQKERDRLAGLHEAREKLAAQLAA